MFSKRDRKCRVCHIVLTTNAEYRIGVHVGCVAEAQQRWARVNIRRPGYSMRSKGGGRSERPGNSRNPQ